VEAKRYIDLTTHLTTLSERRRQTLQRVERLRRMNAVLDPFKSDEHGAGVQENLITRDGEVEKELERTRVLLVRVGARVAALPENEDDNAEMASLFRDEDSAMAATVAGGGWDLQGEMSRKVDALLEGL
jgi:hypothetical protein